MKARDKLRSRWYSTVDLPPQAKTEVSCALAGNGTKAECRTLAHEALGIVKS
jgi:hypothetical protein